MLYVCAKCKKEFKKLCYYKSHIRRILPCVQPTDLEIVRDEMERILKYVDQYTEDKTAIPIDLIKRKIEDLHKYHRNLSADDKKIIEADYTKFIAPVLEKLN